MAKISLKLDKRKNTQRKDGRHPLILYLSHKKNARKINLKYSFHESEWDQSTLSPIGVTNAKLIGSKVRNQLSAAEMILDYLQLDIDSMSIQEIKTTIEAEIFSKSGTSEGTKKRFIARRLNTASLTDYADRKIQRLEEAKKYGNKEAVRDAMNAMERFFKRRNILFSEFDYHALQNFCAYCYGRGNSPNTVGAYLRQVKAIFNEAIDAGDIKAEMYPFKKNFKMPKSPKTKNRALRIEDIQKIRELDLKQYSAIWNARNYFLFMFNNMGINFIDLVKIKKSQLSQTEYDNDGNLVSGRVHYERSKTGGDFSIKLTKEAVNILNFYDIKNKAEDDFIFQYGYEESDIGHRRYLQHRKRLNAKLKEIGKMAKIDEVITTYYARHSWATIGKRNNLPITLISEALGHADTKTTEIYLASFDNEILDDANEMIVA